MLICFLGGDLCASCCASVALWLDSCLTHFPSRPRPQPPPLTPTIKSVNASSPVPTFYIRLVLWFPGGSDSYTQFTMSSFLPLPGLTNRPSSFCFQNPDILLDTSLPPSCFLSLSFFYPFLTCNPSSLVSQCFTARYCYKGV